MPTNTTYVNSRPAWIVDYEFTPRDLGAQIDWNSIDPLRVDANGNKFIPSGTIMARIVSSGKIIPRADIALTEGDALGTEVAVGLLIGEANEADKTDALTGYGLLLGGVVYENLLPDFGGGTFAAAKTELETNAVTFTYLTHTNSIAD